MGFRGLPQRKRKPIWRSVFLENSNLESDNPVEILMDPFDPKSLVVPTRRCVATLVPPPRVVRRTSIDATMHWVTVFTKIAL